MKHETKSAFSGQTTLRCIDCRQEGYSPSTYIEFCDGKIEFSRPDAGQEIVHLDGCLYGTDSEI